MRCRIEGNYIKDINTGSIPFKGTPGTYIMALQIILPDGYTYDSPNPYYDMDLDIQVIIEADQTP